MKRIALTAAAFVVLLPASGALTSAFAAVSEPTHHHVRVIHHRQMLSQEEQNRLSTAQAQFAPNLAPRSSDSGPEWYCQHSGCGWEPHGW